MSAECIYPAVKKQVNKKRFSGAIGGAVRSAIWIKQEVDCVCRGGSAKCVIRGKDTSIMQFIAEVGGTRSSAKSVALINGARGID